MVPFKRGSYDSEIQIIDLQNKVSMISLVKLPSEWKQEWIHALLTNDYNEDANIVC